MCRRLWPCILLMFVWALLLSACTTEDDGSLQRIRKEGYITFAMGRDFPPFYFHDNSDRLIGFEVDVAREIARRLGVRLKLMPVNWSGIIDGLKQGRYDGILASMSITESRKAVVAFSVPYYHSASSLFIRKDADFRVIADLTGKAIGVAAGTTYESDARDTLSANVKYFDNAEAALTALQQGGIDGVVTDRVVGIYVSKLKRLDVTYLGTALRKEEIAAAFRPSDLALLNRINQILGDMTKDGTLNRFIKKVAGNEYPYP